MQNLRLQQERKLPVQYSKEIIYLNFWLVSLLAISYHIMQIVIVNGNMSQILMRTGVRKDV